MRYALALALGVVAIASAIVLGARARRWNEELAIESPFAHAEMHVSDPHTPQLARRVVLVVIDGLGADESKLPYLDELRARGVAAVAAVPYPTVSRPNYITILTGVPPRDSGVRANRVLAPVAIDSVMNRVRAVKQHTATASDYGSFSSLFVRGFDDVRHVDSLAALGPVIGELVAADDAAFVAVLVLDVDRAGHAFGIGPEYRAAAIATDAMLRDALARVDFARDAVIVTADHGHVAPGGHGGTEREVSRVPLVLVGQGIRPGATLSGARLIDVAPTIAALLGVRAPDHAEGRTLVEALALDADAAARRTAADTERTTALATILAGVHATRPDPLRLAVAIVALVLAAGIAVALRRRMRLSPVGAIAFGATLLAMVVVTRGHLSPSYVPPLARAELLGAVGGAVAIALHVGASWFVLRRATDRVATARGIAFIGLAVPLVVVAFARAWFSPPFVDVPSPAWMVAVPTLDLASATCAIASIIVLLLALGTRRDTR